MPVDFTDQSTFPESLFGASSSEWFNFTTDLLSMYGSVPEGVGYLTIDQKLLNGNLQRRGGLHVDGGKVTPTLFHGSSPLNPWRPLSHGASPRGHSSSPVKPEPLKPGEPRANEGMILASTVYACNGYVGDLDEEPGVDGDCEHLRDRISEMEKIEMEASTAYWCNHEALHESIPADGFRQFVRVSMPSTGHAWFDSYTENPCGLKADAIILSGKRPGINES